MIARQAERDVCGPERKRRSKVAADLILTPKRKHGRDVTRRAVVQQNRQHEPQCSLKQHYDPEDQPWPRTHQFDDQGCESHGALETGFAGAA